MKEEAMQSFFFFSYWWGEREGIAEMIICK